MKYLLTILILIMACSGEEVEPDEQIDRITGCQWLAAAECQLDIRCDRLTRDDRDWCVDWNYNMCCGADPDHPTYCTNEPLDLPRDTAWDCNMLALGANCEAPAIMECLELCNVLDLLGSGWFLCRS